MTIDDALHRANTLHRAGHLVEAGALFRQVVAVDPNHPGALHSLGIIALASGRFDEALELIPRAIALSSANAIYHSNLGETYRRLGRFDEAIAAYEHALTLKPDLAETRAFLGAALIGAMRFDDAIASCQRALADQPDLATAHNNLGTACSKLSRWDEAVAAFRCAAALVPDDAEMHVNLGVALFGSGRFDESLASSREAVRLRPAHAEAHWNLAVVLLLLGRYEEGWREHEWRSALSAAGPHDATPSWDGGPAPGETLLLHAEQGIGDTIQFLRYVPLARERAGAGRLLVECQPELARFVAQNDGCGAEVVSRGAAEPRHDRHRSLLSLPLALQIFDPLPAPAPYLRAAPELRSAWRARLGPGAGLRVGVVWAGNPAYHNDQRRSIAFEKLAPLLRVPGVEFFNLQIGARADGMTDLTAHIGDFADTAAFMAELDLIISVDTAAAHLAGALGRPVWTLLPFVPDWRWGIEREDTPWYPTMRLFRQRTMGDWDEVIARVVGELNTMR